MKLIHISEPKHKRPVAIRKATAILKFKPKYIFFETPKDAFNITQFNRYEPNNKPVSLIEAWKANLINNSKKYPWLKTETLIVDAIVKLWKSNHQIYLYNIDAPISLTSIISKIMQKRDRFQFDVWNFLREWHMCQAIAKIKLTGNGLIFCHDMHWKNIKWFLRNKPSKNKFYKHYFGLIGLDGIYSKLDLLALKSFWNKFMKSF